MARTQSFFFLPLSFANNGSSTCSNHANVSMRLWSWFMMVNWVDLMVMRARKLARVDLLMVTSFRLMHHCRRARAAVSPISIQVAYLASFPRQRVRPKQLLHYSSSNILPRKHFDCAAALKSFSFVYEPYRGKTTYWHCIVEGKWYDPVHQIPQWDFYIGQPPTTCQIFTCFSKFCVFISRVRTFWETHKIWKNLPHGFDKSADLLRDHS